MADFRQAVEWLKELKKVHRVKYPLYVFYCDPISDEIKYINGHTVFTLTDFMALDWEVKK